MGQGQIVEGAQAWTADGGDVGVLVLHGFTGSPWSVRPWAEGLAAKGHRVELPLLPGHGTRWQDMAASTWEEWVAEAEAALDRLVARTRTQVVVGLSMGGTLTLRLAEQRADLAGIALVNPSLFSDDPVRRFVPLLSRVVASVPGIGSDIAKPGTDERAYDRVPLRALASFARLEAVVRRDLARVTAPVLVMTSRVDHVVPPECSRAVMDGVCSTDREQVWLERSHHVATLDHDADLIVDRTAQFVHRVTQRADPADPPPGS